MATEGGPSLVNIPGIRESLKDMINNGAEIQGNASCYFNSLVNVVENSASLVLLPNNSQQSNIKAMTPGTGSVDFTFQRNTTATRINKDGLIEQVPANMPRLDYLNGDCPEILIQPQATNIFTYSDPDNLQTGMINTEIQANDWNLGFNNKLVLDNGNNSFDSRYFLIANLNIIDGQIYTIVFLARNQDGSVVTEGISNRTDTDIAANVAGGQSNDAIFKSIELLKDDIYFCKLVIPATFNKSITGVRKRNGQSTIPTEVTGLQIFEGDHRNMTLSSYIPTNGSIVTRNADNAYINNFTPKYSNRILNNKLSINDFTDYTLPTQTIDYGFSFDDLIGVNTYDNFNINEVEYYDVDVDTTNFREGLKDDTTLSLFPSENNTVGSVRTLQDDSFDFDRNSNATRVNKEGLIESVGANEMRVDYSTGEGSILIEPQRTNLINYSDSTDSNYSGFGYTSELNDWGIGLNNKIVIPDSTSYRLDLLSDFSTGTHTLSFYVKKFDGTIPVIIQDFKIQIGGTVIVDGVNGDINIELFKNDIYKIWVSVNRNVGGSNNRLTKGGVSVGLEFGGFQLEEGSYPTSYIPTNGTIQTRVRDFIDIKDFNTPVVNNNSFSVIMEYELLNPDANDIYGRGESLIFAMFKQGLPAFTTQFAIFKRGSVIGIRVRKQDVSFNRFLQTNIGIVANTKYKMVMNYIPNDKLQIIQNGVLWEFTNNDLPEFILDRGFFQAYDNSSQAQRIYNFQLLNKVITDQEAINLTTI